MQQRNTLPGRPQNTTRNIIHSKHIHTLGLEALLPKRHKNVTATSVAHWLPWRKMRVVNETIRAGHLLTGATAEYTARLARRAGEVHAAQTLRYAVFNLELHEGLAESAWTGVDEDPFDAFCDHLIVEHTPTGEVVGTYRLQTGWNAAAHLGYYSGQEFDLARFEEKRGEIIELGRACVHRLHRNLAVLGMLWKGIAEYAQARGARYLIGCSSINSQEPTVGATAYNQMCRRHLATAEWVTRPLPGWECPLDQLSPDAIAIPKLLRAYLGLGAKICGAPALDRHFKTIDFLTMLDLQALPEEAKRRFLR